MFGRLLDCSGLHTLAITIVVHVVLSLPAVKYRLLRASTDSQSEESLKDSGLELEC